MSQPNHFTLPAWLDTGGAAALATELSSRRGQNLTLDASGVERVGALGLQVLLSARVTWARDGEALTLERPSPALSAAFVQAGLPQDFARSA